MNPTERTEWRGTSVDERIADRRNRLLMAGYQIVGNEGAPALTVRAVCAAANVGQRYFYESYPDIEALLGAVYDQAVGQLLDAVGSGANASSSGSLRMRIRDGLGAAADFLAAAPTCGRIVFIEALTNEVIRTRAAKALPVFFDSVRQVIDDGRVVHSDSSRARLETSALSGALTMVFADWLTDPDAIPRSVLVDYCTDVAAAVLELSRPTPPR